MLRAVTRTARGRLRLIALPLPFTSVYGFGAGEAIAEAAGGGEFLAFFAPIGPSFTILASSVPSAFLQYEPLASSFSVMSCIVAVFAPLVMEVLSVTVKVRDCFLPAIVNVFAF